MHIYTYISTQNEFRPLLTFSKAPPCCCVESGPELDAQGRQTAKGRTDRTVSLNVHRTPTDAWMCLTHSLLLRIKPESATFFFFPPSFLFLLF